MTLTLGHHRPLRPAPFDIAPLRPPQRGTPEGVARPTSRAHPVANR